MNIYEFADICNLNLVIKRRTNWHDPKSTWFSHFEYVDVKNGIMLTSTFGNGPTPQDAVADYCRVLQGKEIVLHAHVPEYRKEFTFPAYVKEK